MTYAQIEGKLVLSGCFIINDKKELLLLYRFDNNYYETPGGKVELSECENKIIPTIKDLEKTALREVFEELGKDIKLAKLNYFGNISFSIPNGKEAIANKFITKIISGNSKINEPKTFSKLDYLPINKLENYPISPDLKLFLPKLKELYEVK
jgi:8-oxo-dGTP pyrophosphatase MutT (NUDIX family)